jgi:hypothetical protein
MVHWRLIFSTVLTLFIKETCSILGLLFEAFSDLIGNKSIQYANGAEGRKRRHLIDEGFSHKAVAYYYDHFVKVQGELLYDFLWVLMG